MTKKYLIMKEKWGINLLTISSDKFVNKSSKFVCEFALKIFYKDYISKIFETK
jgi:hypothetical protein